MTFYLKRPGQDEGAPVGSADGDGFGWCDATLDEWALYLPHQCDAWEIAVGDRETVLADAKKFRAELDHAIAMIEQETT